MKVNELFFLFPNYFIKKDAEANENSKGNSNKEVGKEIHFLGYGSFGKICVRVV
jgi:hypothetical protein